MDGRKRLALILANGLHTEQLLRLRYHVREGVKVCCGKLYEWWIHPSGAASIEVLACELVIPDYETEVRRSWQMMFMRLCRSGPIMASHLQLHREESAMAPLTEYTQLLYLARQGDIVRAISSESG